MNKETKINFTSTVAEKAVDIAKEFLSDLISPTIKEVGLLVHDKVKVWRFNNQIKMLNKAKDYCVKHNINPKKISFKLIAPLVEYAGMEEDEELQDKWVYLLGNLVDSEQNIENHVFPYILSQVSKQEFKVLEDTFIARMKKITPLNKKLTEYDDVNAEKINDLNKKINYFFTNELTLEQTLSEEEFQKKRVENSELRSELNSIINGKFYLEAEIKSNVRIDDSELEKYEVSNLTRLGVLKEMPILWHGKIGNELVLTELGEMFLAACSEKS